ncbi:hypothetical protein [Prosthecobacter vanneervenii]|uniref:Uncharacterized protein n=1 Tax=Prosthecobacter vanneervenii TaxID=48466 RepID=A0A7W8DI69_9BACT|nr:hypothetical protein [Prosthecobacter vanneervenii]MBB5030635.1 hypothetical protein [Prosthecobacter vanneervenii]
MISQHQPRITIRWFSSSPHLQLVVAAAMCLISAALGGLAGSSGKKMKNGTDTGHVTHAVAFDAGASVPATSHSANKSPASVSVSTSALEIPSSAAPASPPPFHAGEVGSRDAAAFIGGAGPQAVTARPVRAPSALRRPDSRVLVPMIFREVSPAAGLSGEQVATIDQMRNQFNEKVGTPSSPSDPRYRARWVSAQVEMDDQLRAYLGWEKFNQYQLHAAQSLR